MNYIQLQESVAQRLNRYDMLTIVPPSTTAPIPTFVRDRVAYFQKSLFSPSSQEDYSITTVAGQSSYSFYTYPTLVGIQDLSDVYLLQGGQVWIPLVRVDWFRQIVDADALQPELQTLPAWWASYGQVLRLYPCPNTAYPLRLLCNLSPPPPVLDTDENFWTLETGGAATLIIESVCAELCRVYLNDMDRAQAHDASAMREFQSLKDWTRRVRGPSQIAMHL